MLVVINARIEPTYAEELLKGGPAAIRAFALGMAKLLLGEPRIEQAGGSVYVTGPKATVRIGPDGIVVQGSRLSATRAELEAISQLAATVGQALAIPLAQERLVGMIKDGYGKLAVTSDTQQGAARVTRVRIPV